MKARATIARLLSGALSRRPRIQRHAHSKSAHTSSCTGPLSRQDRYPKAALRPASTQRKTLAVLEPILATGKDTSGRMLTADEKRRLGAIVTQLRFELVDIAKVVVALPTLLFDDELELSLGKRKVILHNWGRANSPSNVTAYVPDEQVFFTGDFMVYPVPFTGAAYPIPWIEVLRRFEQLPRRRF